MSAPFFFCEMLPRIFTLGVLRAQWKLGCMTQAFWLWRIRLKVKLTNFSLYSPLNQMTINTTKRFKTQRLRRGTKEVFLPWKALTNTAFVDLIFLPFFQAFFCFQGKRVDYEAFKGTVFTAFSFIWFWERFCQRHTVKWHKKEIKIETTNEIWMQTTLSNY